MFTELTPNVTYDWKITAETTHNTTWIDGTIQTQTTSLPNIVITTDDTDTKGSDFGWSLMEDEMKISFTFSENADVNITAHSENLTNVKYISNVSSLVLHLKDFEMLEEGHHTLNINATTEDGRTAYSEVHILIYKNTTWFGTATSILLILIVIRNLKLYE